VGTSQGVKVEERENGKREERKREEIREGLVTFVLKK
jgi:hypothetical protein